MWFGEDNDVINRTLRNDGLDIGKKDEETKIQEKTGECWIDSWLVSNWFDGYVVI
jgi:hypothetical protein